MTPTQLSCPKCGAVLRTAKPLPAGKKVSCPKCGAGFAVPGERRAAPARASAPKQAAGVQKKPAGAPVPVAPVLPPDDEDEGGGTYTVKTEEASTGPEINYVPDTSTRDMRGPAVEALINPSNKMMLVGATGFLGWVAFAIALSVPLLFPLGTGEEREKKRAEFAAKVKEAEAFNKPPPAPEEESSFYMIGSLDFREIAELPWYLIIPCLLPLGLGLAYSAAVSAGAVKVQNLESREWGVASSIMAMIPFNAGGLLLILAMVLNLILDLMFEGFTKYFYMSILLVAAWGTNLAVGIWMLTTLNKPEVIEGFEYRPE
jgi:hypothetical protein